MIEKNRWPEISNILDILFELPLKKRREQLNAYCKGDAELQQQLLNLLSADENAPRYLDGAAADLISKTIHKPNAVSEPFPDKAGVIIGSYQLIKKIGQGGMGVVYLAQRVDAEFQHQVAIKLLNTTSSGEHRRARFLQERQLLASLNHPNIAQLFDGGISESGQPYIVMELVDGQPINQYCATMNLNLKQRLLLVIKVAEALSYIHQHFVIHRDIKPANIFVTKDGKIKLLDFGIAKLLDDETSTSPFSAAPNNDLTRTGEHFITPRFAAPEQLKGGLVSVATDVYQLGLVLYELLCGQQAFHDSASNIYQLARLICEKMPGAPSVIVSQNIKKNQSTDRQKQVSHFNKPQLERALRGDLDAIALKALCTDASGRYRSMQELSQDIFYYLQQRPVKARHQSFPYRFCKFFNRHWLESIGTTAIVLLIFVYAVTLTIQSNKIEIALQQSKIEAQKAQKVSDLFVETFESADPFRLGAEKITVKQLLDSSKQKILSGLYEAPEVKGYLMLVLGDINYKLHQNKESIELLEQALKINRRIHLPNSEIIANNYASLGYVYFKSRKYHTAEITLNQALSIYESLDNISPSGLNRKYEVINDLGLVKINLGDVDQAVLYWEGLITNIESQNLRSKTPLANAYSNLALVLHRNGEIENAIEYSYKVLHLREQFYGPNHSETAIASVSLAVLLMDVERYKAAKPLFLKALDTFMALLNEDHPVVINTKVKHAILKHRMGNTEAAINDLNKVLSLLKGVGGNNDIFKISFRLADIYYDAGEFERAEKKILETIDFYQTNEVSTYFRGAFYALLANIYLEQKNTADALIFIHKAMAMLPGDSMRRSMANLTYARLLLRDKKLQQAYDLAKDVLLYRQDKLPKDHRLTEKANIIFAASMLQLGNVDNAIPRLAKAYQALRHENAAHNPYLAIAEKHLFQYFNVDKQDTLIKKIKENY